MCIIKPKPTTWFPFSNISLFTLFLQSPSMNYHPSPAILLILLINSFPIPLTTPYLITFPLFSPALLSSPIPTPTPSSISPLSLALFFPLSISPSPLYLLSLTSHPYHLSLILTHLFLRLPFLVCIFCIFFLFCNIFVTGIPVKFGLLSPGRARQRRSRAYPGQGGNRT
jgi:hypothetical protein